MEWVETTGRTVEEAKDKALDQLGVDEQDAEFEILEDAKVGLFGRLRAEARVRARVRPTRPRPKEDRRDRRRKKESTEEGTERTGNGGRRARTGNGAAPPTTEKTTQRGNDVEGEQDVPLAEQAAVAEAFLAGLLRELGSQATVTWQEVDEDTVEVAISGDELGALIGPKGATLTALQDVTRTVVQRRTGGRNGRLFVDVAGYRQKRREALGRFTRDVAAAVQASGERRALEPMHPADRKVVHDTVNQLTGVRTVSEGEDPRRRVVIVPED